MNGAYPATLVVRGVDKAFTLHVQGGVRLAVLRGVSLTVSPGECVILGDPSGAGKSTLLRLIYGNYRTQAGEIIVVDGTHAVDIARAEARAILALRRRTIGYVSQFLRVVPRVAAVDVVAEPLRARGMARDEAAERALSLLARLRIPERLWSLSPVTFSGGEQQRVNIARGFVAPYPLLLLDEPTASLDAEGRAIVVGLIREAKTRAAAILGTAHDPDVRAAIADRVVNIATQADAA